MLVELFIFFQIVAIGFFITAFFTRQEILWGVSIILFAFLMFMSYSVDYYVYEWNNVTTSYDPVLITHSYAYLTTINLIFFGVALALLFFDIYDKYGSKGTGGGR